MKDTKKTMTWVARKLKLRESKKNRQSNLKKKRESKRELEMKMMRAREDCFPQFPDELLINILIRAGQPSLPDVKFLCRCSLVCQRLNALVPQITTLSITLISHVTSEELFVLRSCLEKFTMIRSLCLEIPVAYGGAKWKATYEEPGNYVFAAVGFNSIITTAAPPPPFQDEEGGEEFASFFPLTDHVNNLLQLHDLVISSIGNHQNLETVSISDANKLGMLYLGHEQLIRLRGSSFQRQPQDYKIANIPTLHLPAGLLMNGVQFYFIRFGGKACAAQDDDLVSWDFEDHEKVFEEALTLFFRYHKQRITVW